MNIKKIVTSQRVRHAILKALSWIPDSVMLPLQYKILLHRWPDLKNPKRFTEWIQAYKMNYRNPLLPKCVDKYMVRDYVVVKGGDTSVLNTLYQVCNSASEIDFESLPDKFVIKTTNGGNGDEVLIVKDKSCLNVPSTIEMINSWMGKNYSSTSREWAYIEACKSPRIIVEEYLEQSGEADGLNDYKFFCFNGVCRFFKVDFNRFTEHQSNYYYPDGTFINVQEGKFHPNPDHSLPPAEEIASMIALAERLSSGLPFVRIDLYDVNHRIIFGEMTFYPMSGYGNFTPDEFDFEAGRFFAPFTEWEENVIGGGG